VTGVGSRTTPVLANPLLLDLEVGAIIHERFRVGVEAVPGPREGFPFFQMMGHAGYDVAHVPGARPDTFGALTLWGGGGWEQMDLITANEPRSYGGFASARVTFEYKWGAFLLRAEGLARLQFVTQFENIIEGEGTTWKFAPAAPVVQLGVKLGVGFSVP